MVRMGGRKILKNVCPLYRGRARTLITSKMAFFKTIVSTWKPLTVLRKSYRVLRSASAVSTSIRSYDNQFRSHLKLKYILKLKWDPWLSW